MAAVIALAVAPLPVAPAGAAPTPRTAEAFTLHLVQGELLIRGADEPHALQNPTSISGTTETTTGAITGGSFVTPVVRFEQQITDPLTATVYIDATFTEASPGTSSGTIDADGNLVVQTSLDVALHVEVSRPSILTANCRPSGPVKLTFETVVPHDSDTGRVTIEDADFAIPRMVTEAPCSAAVQEAIDEQLAGSGHSLTMTLEGAITHPPRPPAPADVNLAIDPAAGSRLGDVVTLEATVSSAADAEEPVAPTGFVDFLDGRTLLATVPVTADGRAVLTTSDLLAGNRRLTASYRGDANNGAATSAVTPYLVSATPVFQATLPPTIVLASPTPTPLQMKVKNTGLGLSVTNPRIDIGLRRSVGTGPLTTDRVALDYQDETGHWQTVALSGSGTLTGSITPPGSLDPGDELAYPMRISIGTNVATLPGPLEVAFTLVDVGDATVTVATSSGTTTMVETPRRASTVTFGTFGVPAVWPPYLRQGNTLRTNVNVGPAVSGVRPTGWVEWYIDGVRVKVRGNLQPLEEGYVDRLATGISASLIGHLTLPPWVTPGVHQLTAKYLGDRIFAPGQVTAPFTVAAAAGPVYDCQAPSATDVRFGANLVADGALPSVGAQGATLPISGLDLRLLIDRGPHVNLVSSQVGTGVTPVGTGSLEGIDFTFGPGGTGTATATERTGASMTTLTDPPPDPDQVLAFQGETGSFVVDGAPGEVIPVTVDAIDIVTRTFVGSFPQIFHCVPVDAPAVLGEVTVAATTLSVVPAAELSPGVIRQGTEVDLTATVAPAAATGFVEFLADGTPIGFVPVDGGRATMRTDSLAAATEAYDLQAVFHGGVSYPTTESNVERLTVRVARECPAAVGEGSGAVVRLVYLELLGRCPDPVGFDYWTGRLDGGTSPEVFARSIARTPEAVGRVVDDAYRTMLGRSADGAGRAFWTGRLLAHGRYDVLLADLGASPEFWSRAGATDSGFVARVYERLLQRSPDQAGQDYWVGRLGAGTPRRALIGSLATLAEPLGVIVTGSYGEILSRRPTPAELSDGIALLRRSGDRSGLYAQLIGTEEFFARAQGFPNPED